MKIKRLTASFIISAMVIGTVGCSDKIELSNDSYENDSTDQVTEDLSATEEAEENEEIEENEKAIEVEEKDNPEVDEEADEDNYKESDETREDDTKESDEAQVNEEDDFNDFVEVTFEHVSYPEIADDKPDYSGIYCSEGFSTTYGYCELIKQEDGSYYCDIFEYRAYTFEGNASYKSDNLLEFKDDYSEGTITIENDSVTVSVNTGDSESEYVFGSQKHEMPEIDEYTGIYTYTTKDDELVTITVGYDDNRVPFVTVSYGEKTISFEHMPSDRCIWILEDKLYGNILYASIEDEAWAPDSEVFSFTQNYSGDKYVVINLGGDKPMVYYKTYEPVVMH
ncbi:hypothetical protein [Butyrivibrio fibrisolvens]|uniref:hypothetical protein n=1 Tax=Butyrivibrio fibrisolvens TaxID=831 RepID=UPI0003B6317C|nr:hypothetical protein [Butyrivibrio fibrisolvens]